MRKENPKVNNLKYTTYQAIQQMVADGFSQKTTCKRFFSIVSKSKVSGGFKITSFEKFHTSYRKFKQLQTLIK